MNFKIARIKLGITQKQLREILLKKYSIGISPTTIVEIEKGNYARLSYDKMVAFADILDSTVQELFFSEE